MKDENSKNSEFDLNKILEEYSAIGQNRDADNVPKPQTEKKKFVLHIDESLIDVDDRSTPSNQNNNGGGIYFSNYQRSRPARPVEVKETPVAKHTVPTKKKTVSKKMLNENIEKIGGKAAVAFLSFILIGTILSTYFTLTCVGDMLAINRSDENVEVMIPEKSSYSDIIDILEDNGLIKRKLFCKVFTKYRDFDDEEYLSGNYFLSASMGVEGMLKDIMAAPVTADTIKLSFPEGWTIQQIFEKLEKNDVCDTNKLYSCIRSSSYDYDFITEIKDDSKKYLKFEGYLFPDTYDFYVGADPNYVIKKLLDNFESKWTDEYQARADKLGYTTDEILTIASIIQKEAANSEQMKTISSVIHNRLSDSANYPTLGCDSTAIYISNYVTPVVGEATGKIYYNNYDTSAVRGLPPGPICNPGMDAIKAALYPEDTDYYFFAHDNNGKLYLASTYTGHKNNLVKIIKANNSN